MNGSAIRVTEDADPRSVSAAVELVLDAVGAPHPVARQLRVRVERIVWPPAKPKLALAKGKLTIETPLGAGQPAER